MLFAIFCLCCTVPFIQKNVPFTLLWSCVSLVKFLARHEKETEVHAPLLREIDVSRITLPMTLYPAVLVGSTVKYVAEGIEIVALPVTSCALLLQTCAV